MTYKIVPADIGDEFVLYFGVDRHRVNAVTFTNSIREITFMLKEINRIINPDSKIEVYAYAAEAGSFKINLKIVGEFAVKTVPKALGLGTGLLIGTLALFLKDPPRTYEGEENTYTASSIFGDVQQIIVQGNKQTQQDAPIFEFSEEELKRVNKASRSSICYNSLKNLLKCLDADEKVKSLELTEKSGNNSPLVNLLRKDFQVRESEETKKTAN